MGMATVLPNSRKKGPLAPALPEAHPPSFVATPEIRSTETPLFALLKDCKNDRARFTTEFMREGGYRSVATILWKLGTNPEDRVLVVADTEEKSLKILAECAKGLRSTVFRAVFPEVSPDHRRCTYGLALAHLPPGPMSIEVVSPPAYNRNGPVMTLSMTQVVLVGKSVELRDVPAYSEWWAREVMRHLVPGCPLVRFREI